MIFSCMWHPQSIAMTCHRSKVTNKHERIIHFFTKAHKRHDAVVRIVTIDPSETPRVAVQDAQGRFALVEQVQIAQKVVQLDMMGVAWWFEQVPVEALCEIPLAPLPKLAAHEQELFPRMPPHVAVEGAQIGETLPEVAGHLVDH